MTRGLPPHLQVAVSGWAHRLFTVAGQIVSIPVLVGALGADRYAAYSVLLSTLAWFAMADLGAGFALQNLTAERRMRGESAAPALGAAGLLALGTLAVGSGLIWLGAPAIGQLLLGRLAPLGADATAAAARLTGVLFLATGVGAVAYRVLYGLGRGVLANLLQAAATAVQLGGLLLLVPRAPEAHRLLVALAVYGVPPALVSVVTAALLYAGRGRVRRPTVGSDLRDLWDRSRGFLIIAFFTACVLNVDYFVMSRALTGEQITVYSLLARVFGVAITMYGVLVTASGVFWTERITLRDWPAVLASWRRHVTAGLAGMALLTVLLLLGRELLARLLAPGTAITLGGASIGLFGLYGAVRILTDASSIALQVAGDTGPLIRWIPLQAVLSVGAQLLLTPRLGLQGVILGLILSFLLTTAWVLPRRLHRLAREAALLESL